MFHDWETSVILSLSFSFLIAYHTLQVPRCTKGAHPIQSYWQIQREISFNLVFWTYQLAQGIKRYDHFRLANWHQSYIIDIIISQSAAAIVTHCQRTEASVSHLHQTLWGRNADSGNFYYTIFQDPGPIEKFYTWNCSQFHTDYEIIIRSDGHLLYTQEPAVFMKWWPQLLEDQGCKNMVCNNLKAQRVLWNFAFVCLN